MVPDIFRSQQAQTLPQPEVEIEEPEAKTVQNLRVVEMMAQASQNESQPESIDNQAVEIRNEFVDVDSASEAKTKDDSQWENDMSPINIERQQNHAEPDELGLKA